MSRSNIVLIFKAFLTEVIIKLSVKIDEKLCFE